MIQEQYPPLISSLSNPQETSNLRGYPHYCSMATEPTQTPFIRELRIYMMANQGVPGFESPIRCVAIALTFIKGPQVDGWVEGILEGLEQLCPINDNIKYTYLNFLS